MEPQRSPFGGSSYEEPCVCSAASGHCARTTRLRTAGQLEYSKPAGDDSVPAGNNPDAGYNSVATCDNSVPAGNNPDAGYQSVPAGHNPGTGYNSVATGNHAISAGYDTAGYAILNDYVARYPADRDSAV